MFHSNAQCLLFQNEFSGLDTQLLIFATQETCYVVRYVIKNFVWFVYFHDLRNYETFKT